MPYMFDLSKKFPKGFSGDDLIKLIIQARIEKDLGSFLGYFDIDKPHGLTADDLLNAILAAFRDLEKFREDL